MSSRSSYAMLTAQTEAEKDAIYRFRFDVFGDEMGLLGPVENWEEPRFLDSTDAVSHHIFAESQGSIIGAIRTTHGEACANSEEF